MYAAGLLALCLFVAELGLSWDIRWHGLIGRDRFLSPPHVVLYAGVALAGLLCALVVLVETARYRHGSPAVNALTTRSFSGFHAPTGFLLSGFGLFTLLLAAPFDNLWHELYGIDVTLWAPAHLMGLCGAAVAGLGSIVAFVSVRNDARSTGDTYMARWAEWSALVAIGALLTLLIVAAQPGLLQYPSLDLGVARVATFPMLMTGVALLVIAAARRISDHAWAATLVVGFVIGREVLAEALIPWATRLAADLGDYSYRVADGEPQFALRRVLVLTPLLVPAVLFDMSARHSQTRDAGVTGNRLVVGALATTPVALYAAALVRYAYAHIDRLPVPPEVAPGTEPSRTALLLGMVVAVAVGMWMTRLGTAMAARLTAIRA